MNPLLMYAVPTPGLRCTWRNYDDTQTIYLTRSPGLNQITLSLSNDAMVQGVLPRGEPRPHGELAAGTALYVFFNGLLSNDEIAAIRWTAEGAVEWKSTCYESRNDRYWVLSPTQDIAFGHDATVAFQLSNVLASTTGMSPLSIELAGAEGLDGLRTSFSPAVQVLNPPTTGNKTLNLNVGFAGGSIIYTSEAEDVQENSLCLYLTNPSPEPLVPGGFDSRDRPPTFHLSLVFGDGPGALTRLSDATIISVNIRNSFGNAWEPVIKQRQGNYPSWLLRPSANGGGTVLGVGEQATVAFDLTGIYSLLPQGMTYAYLGFSDIPGYNDGYYALEIVKLDPVRIRSFTATPSVFLNATEAQASRLEFTVENAGYISISNTDYATGVSEQRLSASTTVRAQSSTTYTLTATHAITGQQVAQSVTFRISPDILHITPIGMITLWHGPANQVPAGWALCDGQNGTPDLRGRFIVGAGTGDYPSGRTGDGLMRLRVEHLPAHTHTATASREGLHQHSTTFDHRGFSVGGGGQGLTDNSGTDSTWAGYTSTDGFHGHNIRIDLTGNNEPFEVIPRFHALHYIKRIR